MKLGYALIALLFLSGCQNSFHQTPPASAKKQEKIPCDINSVALKNTLVGTYVNAESGDKLTISSPAGAESDAAPEMKRHAIALDIQIVSLMKKHFANEDEQSVFSAYVGGECGNQLIIEPLKLRNTPGVTLNLSFDKVVKLSKTENGKTTELASLPMQKVGTQMSSNGAAGGTSSGNAGGGSADVASAESANSDDAISWQE